MKKGFTLIELIATILILALIVIIITPNILDSKDKTKMKMCEVKKETIERSVIMYVQNHRSDFLNQPSITVGQAASYGIIDYDNDNQEVINPYTEERMNNDIINIDITNTIKVTVNINCGHESD